MPSSDPKKRFNDIAENLRRIAVYASTLSFEDYCTSPQIQDAIERCLLRISEAAIKLGSEAEVAFPAHAWRSIRGIGNVLRHEYDTIDHHIIWNAITLELPRLLTDIEAYDSKI